MVQQRRHLQLSLTRQFEYQINHKGSKQLEQNKLNRNDKRKVGKPKSCMKMNELMKMTRFTLFGL